MRLYYATHDGHTRLIAERIAGHLDTAGLATSPIDLARHFPDGGELQQAKTVALIAPIRYGHHLKAAEHLIALYKSLAAPPALAVASVNLTARKPGKDTPEGNPYLRKWLARQSVTPALAAAFAGRLDYPRYGWFDKQMIRLIMKITGGPTDPATQIDYTNWHSVAAFADALAGLERREPQGRCTM